MSSLSIYGVARTRAFRALWMAEELGLSYRHLPIEIGDAGARTPEFLALNPNGRLPVIVDDGFVLSESLAITLYLAKKYSPGEIYPGTRAGEAKAWQWSFWAIAEVDRAVNIWSLHAVRLPPAERDAARHLRRRRAVRLGLERERRARGRPVEAAHQPAFEVRHRVELHVDGAADDGGDIEIGHREIAAQEIRLLRHRRVQHFERAG